MMKKTRAAVVGLAMLLMLFVLVFSAQAATDCSFTTVGTTNYLDGNCTTDETILIPDGFTLDGSGYTITAVDPPAGHFTGAVVANEGTTAHVTNLVVTVNGLQNACDSGADRLRGIMFEGASGSISHTTVDGINQGPSGCQEGNAIEVRNAPFDGTHPNTQIVEIAHNTVTNYQKTGIVANGDVEVGIHHNQVGASATKLNLAANSIQIGFGAKATVVQNHVDGNEWLGSSNYVATAFLVYLAADGSEISQNNIRGNSDVGIYFFADNGLIDNNRVFDEGQDLGTHGDYGVGNWGLDNVVTNNKVRGFDTPYDGVADGNNKVIPGPHNFN